MKKITLAMLAILALGSAAAAPAQHKNHSPQACPFTDNFYLAAATIKSLSGNNLTVSEVSPTWFTTGCYQNSGNNGYVYLTAAGNNGTCNLIVEDGPFMADPSVISSSCQGGMQFAGMNHAYGTYDYTLLFQ